MEFLKKFKEAYNNDVPNWDKSAMWDNIEDQLPTKPKRRRGIFLWIFIGFLCLSIGSLFIYNSFDISIDGGDPLVYKEGKENTESLMEPIVKDIVDNNLTNTIIKKSKVYNKRNNLNQIEDHQIPPNKPVVKNKSIVNLTSKSGSPIALKKDNSVTKKQNRITRSIYGISDTNSLIGSKVFEDGIVSDKNVSYSSENEDLINENIILYEKLPNVISEIDILPKYIELFDVPIPTIQAISPNLTELALRISIGLVNPLLTTNDNAYDEFVDLHSVSKKTIGSMRTELIYRRRLANFYMGLGVGYSNILEEYTSVVKEHEVVTSPSDTAKYYVFNGIKEYVSGEVIKTTTTSTTYKSPVNRTMISIPVELGYKVKLGGLSVYGYSQFDFNVYHNYSGRSYTLGLVSKLDNSPDIKDLYKNKNVHHMTLGLESRFPISNEFNIGFGFSHSRQLNSSINAAIGLDERYHHSQFQLGLIYKLD